MQRLEFVGERETVSALKIDLSEVDQADLITDPLEIKAIIRRAVTLAWKDQIFTYDELANRLERNYVVLPQAQAERDELFEAVIYDIWHTEKELARSALAGIPTFIRHYDCESLQTYYGIVVAQISDDEVAPVATQIETVDREEVIEYAEVIELSEVMPAMTRIEIARYVFGALIKTQVYETVIDIQKIKVSILHERPATDKSEIDSVIKTMIENNYVELRNTGKKKYPRWSIVMDQATKQDVLADIKDGAFKDGLEYMYGNRVEDEDDEFEEIEPVA